MILVSYQLGKAADTILSPSVFGSNATAMFGGIIFSWHFGTKPEAHGGGVRVDGALSASFPSQLSTIYGEMAMMLQKQAVKGETDRLMIKRTIQATKGRLKKDRP